MKYYLVMIWLLVPVAAAAYHYGPGQDRLVTDELVRLLSAGDRHVKAENYKSAIAEYDSALKLIPREMVEKQFQVKLEKAKAMMKNGELPEAYMELNGMETEISEQSIKISDKLQRDIKETVANAEYYVTWVLRLEGEPKEVWKPFIESSRQTYKLLTENATDAGHTEVASVLQKDLEAAIRLERMSIEELQGLNLPCQCKCKGSCKGCCKCNGKKPGKQGKKPSDSRTGAGLGGEIERAGS